MIIIEELMEFILYKLNQKQNSYHKLLNFLKYRKPFKFQLDPNKILIKFINFNFSVLLNTNCLELFFLELFLKNNNQFDLWKLISRVIFNYFGFIN